MAGEYFAEFKTGVNNAWKVELSNWIAFSGVPPVVLAGSAPAVPFRVAIITEAIAGHMDVAGIVKVNDEELTFTRATRLTAAEEFTVWPTIEMNGPDYPIPDEDVLVPEYDDWTVIDSWWPIPDPDEIVPEYDNWMWLGALGAAAYSPVAKAMAVIGLSTGSWALVAYAEDHRIYRAVYPGGEWEEVYDTTTIWNDKWYPAIAGGPIGILAGAGSKLLRSLDAGETWTVMRDLGSVIKSIVVSNQSTTPVFAITVEPTPGSDIDKIYLSYDLGDSLAEDANRAGSISSVQSVVPTGTNEVQTMFTVLGKRTADSAKQDYKIIEA